MEPESNSQVFRILPRNGMMAWKSFSRACFAEPPAESPSTRNSSERFASGPRRNPPQPGTAPTAGLLARAVSQLSRECRAARHFLAHHFGGGLDALLRV